MSAVRSLIITSALGTAAVCLGPLVAEAASDSPAAALSVTHITCVTQEDINGADDAYLVAGGNTIWGPTQMTKGDSKDITGVTFNAGDVLTLMEGDWPDADDNLGAIKIDKAGVYHYTDDGADYWVTVS
ncbi:hypothetical protein OG394_05385 [Kribbella sp. NBC_01245]|uniref:hypothetical protein n=1 Tax=Kribbella sp. NBC_01245 TaxID=2903578 RepID=UPI002E2D5957|nr:hypothetical protein [Kribbella sp. NBC_01245]